LASAQIEKNELDLASSSIKQGLNIEPENSQLHKLMRSVKLKKQVIRAAEKDAAAKAAQKAASGAGGGSGGLMRGGAGGVDSALQKEIMDLQKQFRTTHRDYSTVSADILKAQKTQRVNQITIQELDNITTESETKMYMGVGKMFMAATRDHVHVSLEEEIKDNGKKETELKQKKEYLERRMKSQQQNIIELSNNAAA
jgi:prefoldin subunit 1